jgi:hypothetical protein
MRQKNDAVIADHTPLDYPRSLSHLGKINNVSQALIRMMDVDAIAIGLPNGVLVTNRTNTTRDATAIGSSDKEFHMIGWSSSHASAHLRYRLRRAPENPPKNRRRW